MISDLTELIAMEKAREIFYNNELKEKIIEICEKLLRKRRFSRSNMKKELLEAKKILKKREREIEEFYDKQKKKIWDRHLKEGKELDLNILEDLENDEEEEMLSLYNSIMRDIDMRLDELRCEINTLEFAISSKLSTLYDVRDFLYLLNNNKTLLEEVEYAVRRAGKE